MKTTYIIFFFLTGIAILACEPASQELPDNIGELKEMQKEKKQEIAELNKQLKEIQTRMTEIEPGIFEAEPRLITTLPVKRGEFKKYISIQGSVEADEELFASSESGGRLIQVYVDEGDYVRKGQMIAKVDLESVRKQKSEVEKNLELARDIYTRQKSLWEKNIGSEVDYLQAKNRVETLEKTIETLDHQLTKASVYAPISGEVSMLLKEGGEVVAPGEPIAKLLDISKVNITAEVPEKYLAAVKKGDEVIVSIPALGLEQKVEVSRIGSTIDPQNRAFTVEVEIPNKSGLLKPNLVANMKINDLSREDVISLPAHLVQQEVSGQYFVYVMVEAEGKPEAEKRYVTTGESYDGKIVIEEGLEEGELLIDKGARNVTAGEAVKVVENTVDTSGITSKR